MELGEENMVVDLIGIDASIANAFRRLLIAEVLLLLLFLSIGMKGWPKLKSLFTLIEHIEFLVQL